MGELDLRREALKGEELLPRLREAAKAFVSRGPS
jgi:hypothetical protein